MNKLPINTRRSKSTSLDRKRQVLVNALITQFGTSLIPYEVLSLEFFEGSGVKSALDYTNTLTGGSLRQIKFQTSIKAPKFILVNDLADYLLSK